MNLKLTRILLTLTVAVSVLPAVCQTTPPKAVMFTPAWFPQPASGLRVNGIRSDFNQKRFGTMINVKNTTLDQSIRSFELVWVLGADLRLDPENKAKPETYSSSRHYDVTIEPGMSYQIEDFSLDVTELSRRAFSKGVYAPVVRVGISKVEYQSGAIQIFDLLKNEKASRTDEPPDFGGLDQSQELPHLKASIRGNGRSLDLAKLKEPIIECGAETPSVREISSKAKGPVLKQVADGRCNFKTCNFACLDAPNCYRWVYTCTPSFSMCDSSGGGTGICTSWACEF